MNKFFILTSSFLVLCISMWAGPVSKEQAQQKALVFLNEQQAGSQHGQRAPIQLSSLSVAKTGSSAYYVFNVGEKNGFVIVSGDDQTEPILGFAEEGRFNIDEAPENMLAWLKEYEKQIKWVQENGIVRKSTPRRAAKAAISPMIKSKWNQRKPYNLYCYNEKGKWYAVTGCVATAMAQIMYYHKWPAKTTVTIPEYEYNNITWEAQPATTFDWDNMQETYDYNPNLEANATEGDKAVAKLMRYCGQSVNMQYGENASGASSNSATTAFVKYFGYDEDLHLVKQDKYADDWDELIYNELADGRPVMYGGATGSGGGHSFIVDGYKNGMFSINWGWSGNHDGYFLLTALDPDDDGQTGASSGGYNYRQDAIIGIQKPDGYNVADRRLTINSLTPNADKDYMVEYNVENDCGIEGTYDCALVAIDNQGNVKKTLLEILTSTPFDIGTFYYGADMPQRTEEDTEDYVITLASKLSDADSYEVCIGWEKNRLIAKPEHEFSNAFTIVEYEEPVITGIRDQLNESGKGVWYNLNGMRVEQPTKGVYIRNGKKVVTK